MGRNQVTLSFANDANIKQVLLNYLQNINLRFISRNMDASVAQVGTSLWLKQSTFFSKNQEIHATLTNLPDGKPLSTILSRQLGKELKEQYTLEEDIFKEYNKVIKLMIETAQKKAKQAAAANQPSTSNNN